MKHHFEILVILSILYQCINGIAWTQEAVQLRNDYDNHSSASGENFINVSASNYKLCQLDRLKLTWIAGRTSQIDNLGLAYVHSLESTIATTTTVAVGNYISLKDIETLSHPTHLDSSPSSSLVWCEINEQHCVPKVKSIRANFETNRLILEFDGKIVQAVLSNKTAILDALDIIPAVHFTHMYGEWTDMNVLEIQLDSTDIEAIRVAHGSGDKIEVSARSQPRLPRTGQVTVRPSEPGTYHIVVVDSSRDMKQLPHHLASSHSVVVELCDEATVLPSTSTSNLRIQKAAHSSLSSSPSASPSPTSVASADGLSSSSRAGVTGAARRILTMRGPSAVTGRDPLSFSGSTVDAKHTGTFSVSSWVRLMQPPTGKHRAVLHKGSSDGATRTPSIWLMPNDNRLSVRVSTEGSPDTGAETIGALPTNQWTFLTLVFENHTSTEYRHIPSSAAYSAVTARSRQKDEGAGFVISHPESIYTSTLSVHSGDTRAEPRKTSEKGKKYSISVYFNGQLDVKMDFSDPVVGNEFSAMFFKDISFTGPEIFLSEFTLWDDSLSAAEVQAMYLSNSDQENRIAVNTAIDLLSKSRSSIVHAQHSTRTSLGSDVGASASESVPADPAVDVDPFVSILLQRAEASLAACESFESRLDLYASAAERGSAEALYKWALMIKQGSEVANSACGVATADETAASAGTFATLKAAASKGASLWSGNGEQRSSTARSGSYEEFAAEQERATAALLIAADMGYAPALVPLSLVLMNGIGVSAILREDTLDPSSLEALNIPVSHSYISARNNSSSSLMDLHADIRAYLLNAPFGCRPAPWRAPISSAVDIDRELIGRSVLRLSLFYAGDETSTGKPCPDASQLSLGLLQVAALHRVTEAHQALSYRFKEGMGVRADIETAAYYQRLPARITADEFHIIGAQSIVETDRIDDTTAPVIAKGNEGNDDELIQHQKVRAREGHLPSILAMADLYYYGARGLPRDHARALRYFEQAAGMADESGLCGAAGMHLKGEGTPANVTRAIDLYENASAMGSVRALNGLGYIYFFGQSVPQNHTKAFEYFLAAASYETDADSMFNAAHCLENGLGVEKDIARAVQLYTVGATKLGSFNCITTLAGMHFEGRGVPRSIPTALKYYNAATAIGSWAGWLRRGLDQYLRGNFVRSAGAYLHAAELGYEVSQSNAAYVLRTKVKPPSQRKQVVEANNAVHVFTISSAGTNHSTAEPNMSMCAESTEFGNTCTSTMSINPISWGSEAEIFAGLQARMYILSAHHGNRDSFQHMGNCYFKAGCGIGAVNHTKALWYYTKASFMGSPLASAYVGVMYHFGLGVKVNHHRAERYYSLASEQHADTAVMAVIQSLKYALGMKDYYFMMPVNAGVDYVVRTLWAM